MSFREFAAVSMQENDVPAFALAAEARQRDLPVSIALALLVGGITAAVLESPVAVAWSVAIMLLLIADMEIYRRFDALASSPPPRSRAGLVSWNALIAGVFAALPVALWMDGAPAATAASLSLWIVGVVRPFGAGMSGGAIYAIAGAAPAALSILFAPSLIALTSAQADWDAATIATLGGGAIAGLVVRALWSANAAQEAVQRERQLGRYNDVLRGLMIGDRRALLVDRDGAIVGATFDADASFAWSRAHWREAMESLAIGERVYRDGWEARAWRDHDSQIIGAALIERDAHPINLAPTAAALARRA